MKELLVRLAQIADQLDGEGYMQEANALDDALVQLAPSQQPASTAPQIPGAHEISEARQDAQLSKLDQPIETLVDSIVSRLESEGMSMEDILSPKGQERVRQEMALALQKAEGENSLATR